MNDDLNWLLELGERIKYRTPGPWTVADDNRDDLAGCARFGPVVVYAEDDCEIHPIADCSCNHTCREEDEQFANACLIAAAPRMYELLIRLVGNTDGDAIIIQVPS